MKRKNWSWVLASGLVASSLALSPAGAQDAPVVVPDVVQIDDPVGDANFVNDQDNAYDTPAEGLGDNDAETIGNATDILKVWFTHTATHVSLNVQLNGDPSGLAYDTYYRFSSNAGEGSVASDTVRGCLQWVASMNGTAGAYNGPTEGALTDKCNVGTPVAGPLAVAAGPDGTFVMTTTFPRSYSPLLVDGAKLTAPFGVSRIVYANGLPQLGSAAYATIDNTKRGSDYDLAASAGEPPVVKPPKPPKAPKPGKPKGCDKGKGKKKGCKPAPPAPAACPAYVPGENGAEAELLTVTDAATAENPVTVEFDAGRGLGVAPLTVEGVHIPLPDLTTHNYRNIQVDSSSAEVGLYVRIEFPDRHDYDLYLQRADGSEADHSGDFSTVPESPFNSCGGTSCESGATFEQISGIRTPDCGGWTTDSVAFLTPGGNVTMKVWLGEVLADPAAPVA
jgi:hypothetical protein